MRRSVACAVAVLGLTGAAPAAAQDYGGGRLPAITARDGFTPTLGITLQPRGDRMAFRFDTELKCGSTLYNIIGRSVVPFDGRSFTGRASRRLAIGSGRHNRILYSWVLTGAVDGTIGSGRVTIAGLSDIRVADGQRHAADARVHLHAQPQAAAHPLRLRAAQLERRDAAPDRTGGITAPRSPRATRRPRPATGWSSSSSPAGARAGIPPGMSFETIRYATAGPVATITLDRPERLNTIVPPMPDEVEAAVERATRDADVKVVVLRGAGRAFCAGYDFGEGFKHWGDALETDGRWDPGKDFVMATAQQLSPTQKLASVWRCPKPVIAQVHGWCVGGGSDFALCADLVVASEDAVIGTPYSRMWGAYLSGMWIYRLGLARAKWHALTGTPLTGVEAAACGLINEAVPFERLEARVAEIAGGLARIPSSQLAAQKLVVNQAYEAMGLGSTQTLGPILDGLMRNTPDALAWIERAEAEGVRAAIEDRDGPFGDYSQAPPERRPDPRNVIEP